MIITYKIVYGQRAKKYIFEYESSDVSEVISEAQKLHEKKIVDVALVPETYDSVRLTCMDYGKKGNDILNNFLTKLKLKKKKLKNLKKTLKKIMLSKSPMIRELLFNVLKGELL